MTALEARPGPSDRTGRSLVSIEAGGRRVAWVEVSSARHRLQATATGAGERHAAQEADPVAWTQDAARRSARDRWRDHHRAIRTAWRLEVEPDAGVSPAEVLEVAGAQLAERGVRRIDVRVPASDPIAGALVGPCWVQGRTEGDVVASLAVAYPWTDAPDPQSRLAAVLRPLPPRLRRVVRRVAAVHPRQIPELARSVGTEVAAAVRHRYAPGTGTVPVDGAPAGANPFAASRYRTVRSALALVPDALRSTALIDIGCGDGRVLREALDTGFSKVYGRELDPELVHRARALVGGAGQVDAGDALATPIPDDVGVVYLNNPFASPLLEQLAGLLAASLERRPRPLLVVYLNPQPIDPLLAAGLVLVHVEPRFSVLASPGPA